MFCYQGIEFENHYFCKNTHLVYKLKGEYRPLSLIRGKGGYRIYLSTQTKRISVLIHRLIFAMCNPNIDITNLNIYHLNGDVYDNRLENLAIKKGKYSEKVLKKYNKKF